MALTRDPVFWNAFKSHAECSLKAAALLRRMLAEPATAAALAEDIVALAQEGAQISRQTIRSLHETWLTPLGRDEIYALLHALNTMLGCLRAASAWIVVYELSAVPTAIGALMEVLHLTVGNVAQAVELLSDLQQSQKLLDLCESIRSHQDRADVLYRDGNGRLFKDTLDPLLILKWRDIFDSLKGAVDRAQDIADRLEGILLEHAQ